MIFSGVSPDGRKHFDMVLDGTKTRTTRLSDRYQLGKDYAIQPKRTKKGMEGYRMVIDKKTKEAPDFWVGDYPNWSTSYKDAKAEGGYMPEEFEEVFRKLHPKWDGKERWAYEFHVVTIAELTNLKRMEKKTKEENAILRGYGVSEEEIKDIEMVGRGKLNVGEFKRKWIK